MFKEILIIETINNIVCKTQMKEIIHGNCLSYQNITKINTRGKTDGVV